MNYVYIYYNNITNVSTITINIQKGHIVKDQRSKTKPNRLLKYKSQHKQNTKDNADPQGIKLITCDITSFTKNRIMNFFVSNSDINFFT